MWTRFFPLYDHLMSKLEDGTLINVKFITLNAGKDAIGGVSVWQNKARLLENSNGGGALMTMAVYSIQLALLLFDEEPLKIKAAANILRPNSKYVIPRVKRYFQLNMR